jgi:hypothetical protein
VGVRGLLQTVVGGDDEYGLDRDIDGFPETRVPFPSSTYGSPPAEGQLAMAWAPDGRLAVSASGRVAYAFGVRVLLNMEVTWLTIAMGTATSLT